jgi:hypothetical protein
MFRFPSLANTNVRGPFWTAKVRVLEAATGATSGGVALTLANFDQFFNDRGTLRRLQGNERAFVTQTVEGRTVIAAPDTRLVAAQVKANLVLPESLVFTGRFQVNAAGTPVRPPGAVLQVVVRNSVPGNAERFYSLGVDTERLRSAGPLQPAQPDFRFSLGGDSATLNQIGGERFLPVEGKTNTWFRFRIDVTELRNNQTEVRAKVWEETAVEPAAFQVTVTNAAADRPRTKAVGLRAGGLGNKLFDELKFSALGGEFALRTLFTEDIERDVPGQSRAFTPRTFAVLCEPLEVRIGPAFQWTRPAGTRSAVDLSETEIRAGINSGALSLLMLRADPAELAQGRTDVVFECVSGAIDFNAMTPRESSAAELRRSLIGAIPSGSSTRLAANASGLALRDRIRLPWDNATDFSVPLLLVKDGARARMQLDVESLQPAESAALVRAWGDLSSFLNPRSPLNTASKDIPVPNWLTLEVSNPQAIPRFFREWPVEPWTSPAAPLPPFAFGEGQFNVLLADQQPDSVATPPTSLARVLPRTVSIAREGQRLVVKVNPDRPVGGGLRYQASRSGAAWTESFTIAGMTLAYDPVETARALRTFQQRPAPVWDRPLPPLEPEPLEEPFLWAFMPLEDGWAQLPVPNLTEQIYLDAKLAAEAGGAPPASALQGAVSFANDHRDVLAAHPEEQPWRLMITSGGQAAGNWTLDPIAGEGPERFAPASLDFRMESPDLVVDGLLWLSTGKPSARDALPDHDNWVSGLYPVPLRTAKSTDLFPSLFRFDLDAEGLEFSAASDARPHARLGQWRYTVRKDASLNTKLEAAGVFAAGVSAAAEPLLWRRHGRLPMVQALPLTQSQQPPNYPGASRQLAPYTAAELTFGVSGAGAATFPSFQGSAVPAREWAQLFDLPMASLSVPGVLQKPAAGAVATHYRFDLPYTDEVNALAQLPKVPPAIVTAVETQPLARDTFASHWRKLADKASLAAGDVVEGFPIDNTAAAIKNLIEPFTWDATPALDLNYPGTLSLNGETVGSHEGVTARFRVEGTTLRRTAEGEMEVVAGSMTALVEGARLRDQRGLQRSATTASGNLVETPVELAGVTHVLTSLLNPVSLFIGGQSWPLWFRDLPLRNNAFQRQERPHDVNDPEAMAAERNYLNGYEWRLGFGGDPPMLPFFQLEFYPLTLESLAMAEGRVRSVEVIGRLQLPLETIAEQPDFQNAVRLTFREEGGELRIDSIALAADFVEWPLALTSGLTTNEPRLTWRSAALSNGNLEIGDATLDFFLFGESWSVPVSKAAFVSDMPLSPVDLDVRLTGMLPAAPAGAGLFAEELNCIIKMPNLIDPAAPIRHTASVKMAIRLGDNAGGTFQSSVRFDLLDGRVEPIAAQLFGDLEISTAVTHRGRALQFVWDAHQATRQVQVLAGMHVSSTAQSKGFATMTFDVNPQRTNGVPVFALASGFVEALIPCDWGLSLQERSDPEAERLFGSSAGRLHISFTAELAGAEWNQNLLFNGFLEVKNLISWPSTLTWNPGTRTLTLPATAPGLPHVRHTMRILFNQHAVPRELLTDGAGDLMFTLANGKTWQFLAVVEHQLFEVFPRVANGHRWTALQEVRIATPGGFRAFLEAHPDGNEPEGTATASAGYLRRGLRSSLITELASAPRDSMLIVEASAPHWIRQTEIASNIASHNATTLQFLPDGSQQAILSTPEDFHSDTASSTNWLLLTMPFLGRLQPRDLDIASGPVSVFQVDPITRLGRPDGGGTQRSTLLALTSWADTQPLSLSVAAADAQETHLWPRLDPATLEQNLFRLQRPLPEALPASLPGVLATLPDTPARLSRPVALRRAFDSDALELSGALVWRERSQMVLQGANATPTAVAYGWHLVGLQMKQWLDRAPADRFRERRYAAVTVVPGAKQNSVSYVVSPYLGLDFLPAGAAVQKDLVSAELVCLDRASRRLRPVASRLFDGVTSPALWASGSHQLLAPDSPVAVLRRREINVSTVAPVAGQTSLTATYSFAVVEGLTPIEDLSPRTFPIRAAVRKLRFREAAFGRQSALANAAAFELAPPQVAGVQPVNSNTRPLTDPGAVWPWGWSGLRFSILYGAQRSAAIGSDASTVWWQSPQTITQFRSARNRPPGAPIAGLPSLFRGPAIASLQPVLPTPVLPSLPEVAEWQPVLPGTLQYLITGGRGGTMLALRHQLIRQSPAGSVVSGSVPVQHRVPRPVELPESLQTYASFFETPLNSLVTPGPADEAFFRGATEGAARLKMELAAPVRGAVSTDWDGELTFAITANAVTPLAAPAIASLVVMNGATPIAFVRNENTFKPGAADLPALRQLIERQRPGDEIAVLAKVQSGSLFQILSFPLRIMDPAALPLPLAPFFVHFEDPEYNLRLASSSARAARNLREGDQVHTITLAADRQVYNPGSTIIWRYDRQDDAPLNLTLTVSRIDASGTAKLLDTFSGQPAKTLHQLELAKYQLIPGNSVEIKLTIATDVHAVLTMAIVAEPVVPVPEAAYALLRRGSGHVECVRFAWSPQASRVELVCADDLRGEVVRRRAVFQWRDSARSRMVTRFSYAIQKIASNGATHIPPLEDAVPS